MTIAPTSCFHREEDLSYAWSAYCRSLSMCKSSPVLFFGKGFSPLMLIMIIQDIQGASDDLFKLMSRHKMCVVCRACWHSCSVCVSTQLPPVAPLHRAALAHRCVPSTGCSQMWGKGKPPSLFSESHLTLTPWYPYAKQVVNPLSIWVQCYELSISQGYIMEKLGKFWGYCLGLGIYLSGLSIYHYLSWWSPGGCKRSLKNGQCFSSCINCQHPLQTAGEAWAWLHLGQG